MESDKTARSTIDDPDGSSVDEQLRLAYLALSRWHKSRKSSF